MKIETRHIEFPDKRLKVIKNYKLIIVEKDNLCFVFECLNLLC